jgi:hypothetical protein
MVHGKSIIESRCRIGRRIILIPKRCRLGVEAKRTMIPTQCRYGVGIGRSRRALIA